MDNNESIGASSGAIPDFELIERPCFLGKGHTLLSKLGADSVAELFAGSFRTTSRLFRTSKRRVQEFDNVVGANRKFDLKFKALIF